MFQRCTINIRQKNHAQPERTTWLEVTLLKARVGAPPYKDKVFPTSAPRGDDEPFETFRQMEMMMGGSSWWGRWSLGSSSASFTPDSNFTVGTAHRDSRYWVYNHKTWELHLVQRSVESGWAEKPGAPPTGYKVLYTPALELYGAAIGSRGVTPMQGGEGNGWVRIASRAFRAERVAWEKN